MPAMGVRPTRAWQIESHADSAATSQTSAVTKGDIHSPKTSEFRFLPAIERRPKSRDPVQAAGNCWRVFCFPSPLMARCFAMSLLRFDSSIGMGGESLEAINVEIVNASALESIDVNPAVQANGAAQAVSTRSGAEAPVDQAEVQQQSESRKVPPSATEEALVKPDRQTILILSFERPTMFRRVRMR